MPVSIETIPGAEELLEDIRVLSRDRERQDALRDFFVPYKRVHDEQLYLCNLVFQGGGVLGLAHVGFLAGLEAAGVRCAGLAGTSAGAIVATAVACARGVELARPVHEDLFDILADMPMAKFVDGPPQIRGLIKHVLSKNGLPPPTLWPAFFSAIGRLLSRRGLNPGQAFENWLEKTFLSFRVPDNATLAHSLDKIKQELASMSVKFDAPYVFRQGRLFRDVDTLSMLRVVATGLPSGLKITFPEDLAFLDPQYVKASPAVFVRASMAIPAFFEPKQLEVNTNLWREDVAKRLRGLVARKHITDVSSVRYLYLVDGGLLSNVPVDAFELMGRPTRVTRNAKGQFVAPKKGRYPTIVATLVGWKRPRADASWGSPRRLLDEALRLAQAVRLQRDRDAWRRVLLSGNTSARIVEIDTSQHNWLNFAMTDYEMGQLFMVGLRRADRFLKRL